jgi:hypothetical protein
MKYTGIFPLAIMLVTISMFGQSSTLPTRIDPSKSTQPERPYLAHTETPRLYFSMPPTERIGRVELAASNAELTLSPQPNLTSAEIDAVLQLRGNVQVRMCAPSSRGCDKWSILVRADAVDYNEQTRAMDAHGNVHIDPYMDAPSH